MLNFSLKIMFFFVLMKIFKIILKIDFNVERINKINKKYNFKYFTFKFNIKNILIVIANMYFENKLKSNFFNIKNLF